MNSAKWGNCSEVLEGFELAPIRLKSHNIYRLTRKDDGIVIRSKYGEENYIDELSAKYFYAVGV